MFICTIIGDNAELSQGECRTEADNGSKMSVMILTLRRPALGSARQRVSRLSFDNTTEDSSLGWQTPLSFIHRHLGLVVKVDKTSWKQPSRAVLGKYVTKDKKGKKAFGVSSHGSHKEGRDYTFKLQ